MISITLPEIECADEPYPDKTADQPSEEGLLRDLGRFSIQQSLQGSPAGFNSMNWDFLKAGKDFWNKHLAQIERIICVEWDGCSKIAAIKDPADETKVNDALMDVLAAIFTGVPLVLITKLVLAKGIPHLCNCAKT